MKLELGRIKIKNIAFGDELRVNESTLYLNKQTIIDKVLEDDRIKTCEVELARPGESVRITPIKDVIEPRVKVSGCDGVCFPGVVGNEVTEVGFGRTHVLDGCAVVTVGRIVGFQEGIVDMSGVGADYTPFSKNLNICLVINPIDDIEPHEHEETVREAGIKVAMLIAEAGRNLEPDIIETYEFESFVAQHEKYADLPKVGYVCMLQSQGLLHDTYVYGVDAKQIMPTIISPLELMDGAITSGNCVASCDKVPTYLHQNDPIIKALYEKHGKELNFTGVIITNENVYLDDKKRSSDYVSKLATLMGLDGVIITEEGYGNPDTDLMLNCEKLEKKGIKTVLVTDEFPGKDGKSQSLADTTPEADALVSTGQGNMILTLPPMEKIIGSLANTEIMIGGYEGSLKEDGSIEAEIQIIISSTSAFGCNKLTARYY